MKYYAWIKESIGLVCSGCHALVHEDLPRGLMPYCLLLNYLSTHKDVSVQLKLAIPSMRYPHPVGITNIFVSS